ncbi:MAG: hypothetical protein C0513_03915 [Isosphaera sp.]|nr:hypothetical protein [Isosphaera sp.]
MLAVPLSGVGGGDSSGGRGGCGGRCRSGGCGGSGGSGGSGGRLGVHDVSGASQGARVGEPAVCWVGDLPAVRQAGGAGAREGPRERLAPAGGG